MISFSNEKLRRKTEYDHYENTPVRPNKFELTYEKRLKTSLDKYNHHSRSISENKKKKSLSRKKQNKQNLAIDIWHAYFEKPL